MIANQIATLYESIGCRFELILSEADLRRLTHLDDNARALIFVCQPGKDELDESILEAIGTG